MRGGGGSLGKDQLVPVVLTAAIPMTAWQKLVHSPPSFLTLCCVLCVFHDHVFINQTQNSCWLGGGGRQIGGQLAVRMAVMVALSAQT